MGLSRIPSAVAEKMKYYVYAYIRKSDGKIVYVGEGQGQRALAHLASGRHLVDILAHGLPDRNTALTIEAAVIDALEPLRNKIRGQHAAEFGRVPLKELIQRLGAKRVDIQDPSILIRINQRYRPRMSPRELYEVTRGVWAIGRRRETAQFAMAVYHGVVQEVYRIHNWHPAGTTSYKYRSRADVRAAGRWEFTGKVAEDKVRRHYVGGSVEHLLPSGSQNPIRYVP